MSLGKHHSNFVTKVTGIRTPFRHGIHALRKPKELMLLYSLLVPKINDFSSILCVDG